MFVIVPIRFVWNKKLEKLPGKLENSELKVLYSMGTAGAKAIFNYQATTIASPTFSEKI
jgi:hypothetical protein